MTKKLDTVKDSELDRVCGGRQGPTCPCRDASGAADGDIELNAGPTAPGDPESIF